MSHLCSVCWLKTHCLCSPLHFCRLLYSLRLFVFSFPPAHSFVLVWVSLCCSSSASLLLLQLISLLNWGNLLDKTDKTPFLLSYNITDSFLIAQSVFPHCFILCPCHYCVPAVHLCGQYSNVFVCSGGKFWVSFGGVNLFFHSVVIAIAAHADLAAQLAHYALL